MPILSFIFFDILYLLISFLIFILIVKCNDFFYYTALVEMFSIYMHSKESVLGVICDTISHIMPLATHRNWEDYTDFNHTDLTSSLIFCSLFSFRQFVLKASDHL